MTIYVRECEHAGLDPKAVAKIARGLEKYAAMADKLGLQVFAEGSGGKGSASLRFSDEDRYEKGALVVVGLDKGCWDGGDGACSERMDGLLRGEI